MSNNNKASIDLLEISNKVNENNDDEDENIPLSPPLLTRQYANINNPITEDEKIKDRI